MSWDEKLLEWLFIVGIAAFFLGGLSTSGILIYYGFQKDLAAGTAAAAASGLFWALLAAGVLKQTSSLGEDNEDEDGDDS